MYALKFSAPCLHPCLTTTAGSKLWGFSICCVGVGVFGVLHDFIQEAIFRVEGYDYGWFMTLCEMLLFAIMARFELQLQGSAADISLEGVPWSQYTYLTIVLAITQGAGSVALSYVNMPVKVVMKSCKLIPTMVRLFPLPPCPPSGSFIKNKPTVPASLGHDDPPPTSHCTQNKNAAANTNCAASRRPMALP